MQYTETIEINLSRSRVTKLFDNPENYSQWQDSLLGLEYLSGEPGQQGARTLLHHKMGKREIEMVETITERDLPELFVATYEADGVWNQAINRFHELPGNRTLWTLESEFRCKGLMWILAKLFPGMFRKETRKVMEAFRMFAEGQGEEAPG
tara:strand:+ start:297 stop:749 length:453 start_codon:yes stop_codon:yes gene_type:complete